MYKLSLENNENIFVVSDLHLNHRKLCSGYEDHFDRTRKYVTTEEMNNDIVHSWNTDVTDSDVVIFLGDAMMNTPGSICVDVFKEYYNKLNFKKMYWICGNHDHVLFKKIRNRIEEFPKLFLVYDSILLEYNNKNYLIQHYDFSTNDPDCDFENGDSRELNDAIAHGIDIDYLVHGHTHYEEPLSDTKRTDKYRVQNNVCWDAWYHPVNINELVDCNYKGKEWLHL